MKKMRVEKMTKYDMRYRSYDYYSRLLLRANNDKPITVQLYHNQKDKGIIVVHSDTSYKTSGIDVRNLKPNIDDFIQVGLLLHRNEVAEVFFFHGGSKPIIKIEGKVIKQNMMLARFIERINVVFGLDDHLVDPSYTIIDDYLRMKDNTSTMYRVGVVLTEIMENLWKNV